MIQEFLPLCDVLFNIISLASYFCDVVFDVVTTYTLYAEGQILWFTLALSCILFSLVVSQICSVGWFMSEVTTGGRRRNCNLFMLIILHIFQAGVLFRYFRLFIPVDLRNVKNDVRDLCLLRLVHAFCEAAPMLLLQLYLIWLKPSMSEVTDLNIVSTALSLFSVCWALASFNKNVRRHNVHRLVLTWLGVIFQLLWRLGTVTSRSLALTVYATLYGYWVFLVIALHWVSMFLWLISPKNVFHGEKMPILKKTMLSMLIAFCYIFCYINLQEINPRNKMLTFYLTMVLENTLLVSVWLGTLHTTPWYKNLVTTLVFLTFFLGILFMALYYRHFHVRKLKQTYPPQLNKMYSSCTGCQLGECNIKSHAAAYPNYWNDFSTGEDNFGSHKKFNSNNYNDSQTRPLCPNPGAYNVPGVFNCRFNPVIKRKKKKPTSFVPPPVPVVGLNLSRNGNGGRMVPPFWKRPLPNPVPSDNEGSVGSRVNIQQKLQEKKQQQMNELRKIEEEIRTGKLKRPKPNEIPESGPVRQPIPRAKKQPWMRPDNVQYSYIVADQPGLPHRKLRSQTPEILLSPHYLDNTRIYYECQDSNRWKHNNNNNYQLPYDEMNYPEAPVAKRQTPKKAKRRHQNTEENKEKALLYKSYRIPSDLDSQLSLPRSYTLPREFKYHRRTKTRKMLRMDHFLASTNSSDGDVDSCDENDAHNNGVMVHPGHSHHPHHHYNHYHHQVHHPHPGLGETIDPTPPRPHPRLHQAFARKKCNTHETKL